MWPGKEPTGVVSEVSSAALPSQVPVEAAQVVWSPALYTRAMNSLPPSVSTQDGGWFGVALQARACIQQVHPHLVFLAFLTTCLWPVERHQVSRPPLRLASSHGTSVLFANVEPPSLMST